MAELTKNMNTLLLVAMWCFSCNYHYWLLWVMVLVPRWVQIYYRHLFELFGMSGLIQDNVKHSIPVRFRMTGIFYSGRYACVLLDFSCISVSRVKEVFLALQLRSLSTRECYLICCQERGCHILYQLTAKQLLLVDPHPKICCWYWHQ